MQDLSLAQDSVQYIFIIIYVWHFSLNLYPLYFCSSYILVLYSSSLLSCITRERMFNTFLSCCPSCSITVNIEGLIKESLMKLIEKLVVFTETGVTDEQIHGRVGACTAVVHSFQHWATLKPDAVDRLVFLCHNL